ncbi:MAG: hypothetical protein ACLP1D_19970 [Xanthobacteraceae bacterium]|jgi:hypothetical protein
MIRRLCLAAGAALLATASVAAPLSPAERSAAAISRIEQVRLVCDQDCRCWHTAYRERLTREAAALRALDDDANACPAGGRYNGHYRTGPSVGLGFDTRTPHTSVFPF